MAPIRPPPHIRCKINDIRVRMSTLGIVLALIAFSLHPVSRGKRTVGFFSPGNLRSEVLRNSNAKPSEFISSQTAEALSRLSLDQKIRQARRIIQRCFAGCQDNVPELPEDADELNVPGFPDSIPGPLANPRDSVGDIDRDCLDAEEEQELGTVAATRTLPPELEESLIDQRRKREQALMDKYKQVLLMIISMPQHVHSNRNLQQNKKFWEDMNESISELRPITRVSHNSSLYLKRFEEDIIGRYEPAIIEGLVENHPGWKGAREKWKDPETMMSYYGDVPVCIKEVDKEAARIPLSMFFSYANETNADFPVYMCEKELSRDFLNDYDNPDPFKGDLYQLVLPEGQNEHPWLAYILIGGKGSGSPIHKDPIGTGAWNALISGRKKWCLFPPETDINLLGFNDNDQIPPAYWWQDHYKRVMNDPRINAIEVIQEPGEIMFVPAGWYHVVINLDVTIAVTQNFVVPVMLSKSAKTIASENPTFSRVFLTALYKKRPNLVNNLYRHYKPTDPGGMVEKVDKEELERIRAERAALEKEKKVVAEEREKIQMQKKKLEDQDRSRGDEPQETEDNPNGRSANTRARNNNRPPGFAQPLSGFGTRAPRRRRRRPKPQNKQKSQLLLYHRI